MFKHMSMKLAGQLSAATEYEQDVIAYGIEVVLRSIIKIAAIITIASLLDLTFSTIVILSTSAIFRLVSGGAHCTSYLRCLLTGLIVMLGLAYISELIVPYVALAKTPLLLCIAWLVTTLIVLIWAPAGNVNRPLENVEQRKRFRQLSVLYSSLCFSGLVLYVVYLPNVNLSFVCAMTIGLLWQAFTITPFGYRFLEAFDKLLTFRKEVPTHA